MVLNYFMYILVLLSRSKPVLGAISECNNDNYAELQLECPFLSQGACKDVVETYDYPCEEHTVVTEDGFILGIQRIPKGHKGSDANYLNISKPPILLQHGVFMDGVSFMLIGSDSLAFYLADNGFDVWVANTRGTIYSRRHINLNTLQKEYWDWSVDELVKYDFKATLDYVHDRTGQKVHYLGHSMGAMMVLNAMAINVSSVEHMRSASLISPIAYLNHNISPFTNVAAHLYFAKVREFIGLPEFNPVERPAAELSNLICSDPAVDCSQFLLTVTGPNCCVNDTGIENFLEHGAQSTSTKLLIQLAQNIRGGGLRRFDYDNGNKKHYGLANPPEYDMRNIPKNMPMFFSYGAVDFVADIFDVQFLMFNFWNHNNSRIVKNFQLDYAHADFLEPLVSFLNSN